MPRKPKKRQVSGRKRGISNEHVCVLTAVDSQDQTLIEIIDQGNPAAHKIMTALDNRVQLGTTMITDSKSAYVQVTSHLGLVH